ncbi:DUF1761 domain-containing protein [Candidatus Saccharibacteria bacterium]|nr:DUF1761 domain-containing protein [Candidatus Saccharibacteria bacterium]
MEIINFASAISWKAIIIATVVQFIVGAIWYMFIFAKQWGEMFDFDKLSKKEQKEMQAKMGPYYGLQMVVTLLTSYIFAQFVVMANTSVINLSLYKLAFFVWLGFVVPTQVSAIIFGGVDPKWIPRRLMIMAGGSLACLMAAAFVFKNFA